MNYVKIRRDLIERGWKPDMISLWIHLLLMAEEEDREINGVMVPRGSVMTTMMGLAKSVGVEYPRLRYMLISMQIHNGLTIKSSNKYTIITLSDFESYIVDENAFSQADSQQISKQIHNGRENEEKVTKEKIERDCLGLVNERKKRVSKDTPKKESPKVTDFVDRPGYIPVVTQWLEYKKSRGESYKGLQQLRIMYRNLVNWSGGDPRVAQDMVDLSIGNHYQGLVKPKVLPKQTQENYSNDKYWP